MICHKIASHVDELKRHHAIVGDEIKLITLETHRQRIVSPGNRRSDHLVKLKPASENLNAQLKSAARPSINTGVEDQAIYPVRRSAKLLPQGITALRF